MTKVQFLALVAVAGVSVTASSVLFKASGTERESVLLVHALRIESPLLRDGGPSGAPDTITAYRTKAALDSDGGILFEDVGASDCQADTRALRTWAHSCQTTVGVDKDGKADGSGGTDISNVYLLELRNAGNGTTNSILSIYGTDGRGECEMTRGAELSAFLDSLTCSPTRPRLKVRPL